jgi:hypothetical protein
LDKDGDNPTVIHLDINVSALDSAAPLEIPSNTIVRIEEDITLANDVGENILQTKDPFLQSSSSGTLQNNIEIIGCGGTLDGNRTNQPGVSDGFKECGIHLFGDDITVRGVVIESCRKHNISAVGESSDITARDNQLDDGGLSNLQFHYKSSGGNTDFGDLVTNAEVVGNKSTNAGSTGTFFGLKFSGVNDAEIRNNRVEDTNGVGILVKSGDEPKSPQESVIVSENIVRNASTNGIEVRAGATNAPGATEDIDVCNNRVVGPGNSGLLFDEISQDINYSQATGNTVRDAGGTAIDIPNDIYQTDNTTEPTFDDDVVDRLGASIGPGVTLGGGWTTIDPDRAVLWLPEIIVETDGTTDGSVRADVDFSGGTSFDDSYSVRVGSASGAGAVEYDTLTIPVPAGASVRLFNNKDPNNANQIADNGAFPLSQ